MVPDEKVETQYQKLSGPKISGNKIDLSQFNKPKKKKEDKKPESKPGDNAANKKKRRRISKVGGPQAGNDQNKTAGPNRGAGSDRFKAGNQGPRRPIIKEEPSEEDVQKQIKDTLARLTNTKGKNKGAKHRRDKREAVSQKAQLEIAKVEAEKNIIKVTEFVSVNELANMMDVQVNQVIATCMNLGLFVSINQRLDAEVIKLVASEFAFEVEHLKENNTFKITVYGEHDWDKLDELTNHIAEN